MPCYLPNLSVSVHTPKFLAKVGQVATLAAIVTYLTVSLRAENSVWPFCTCLYAPNFKVEKSWELSEPQGLKVGKNIELLFWTCRGHFDHNFVRFDHKNLWQKCSIVGGGGPWTNGQTNIAEWQKSKVWWYWQGPLRRVCTVAPVKLENPHNWNKTSKMFSISKCQNPAQL